MGAFSDYLENKLLDHTLGGVPFTPPAQRFVSLHTADPTEVGKSAEVTGGGYQRAMASFAVAANGSTSNSNSLAYPNMPAVTVTHIGIHDSANGATSNPLYYGQLTAPVVVTAGGTVVINAGQLTVSID